MQSRTSYTSASGSAREHEGRSGFSGNRDARACDMCRRMKIRCLGKEDPPCHRCRAMGLSCTFQETKRPKPEAQNEDTRVSRMEDEIESLKADLDALMAWRETAAETLSHLSGMSGAASLERKPQVAARPSSIHAHSSYTLAPPSTSRARSESYDSENIPPIQGMITEQETARLVEDGYSPPPTRRIQESDIRGRKRSAPDEILSPMARQRRRSQSPVVIDKSTPRGMEMQYQDPVTMGLCSETEARRLFDDFFVHSHSSIPVYDPAVDTWDSLRARSPFSITVIMFVGKKIQDSGGPVSELQRKYREHAERMGKETLFSPISSLETLQALIILASWGDTGWRPGCHAINMGMDMDLQRCLPRLVNSITDKGFVGDVGERERRLVAGARVWLALTKMKIEMALNYCRPELFPDNTVVTFGRRFLNHPLSLPGDSRLVAAIELHSLRLPMHDPYHAIPQHKLLSLLQTYNKSVDDWAAYWHGYYDSIGRGEDDGLRKLVIQDVRNRRDVEKLSPARKECLVRALRGAGRIVHLFANDRDGDELRHANNFAHIVLAFAARSLLFLASLLPDMVDLRQTGRDVKKVAYMLDHFPGYQFANQLHEAVDRARANAILPPASRFTSPSPPNVSLPVFSNSSMGPPANSTASHEQQQPLVDMFNFDLPADLDVPSAPSNLSDPSTQL
ncbi:hypothetical protein BCR39DRAFT_287210 [Naematelia encephala]|uniref:Zn(2)-C6 fungal-type domain-containing protein n=1 Tax=Naematelia encephala TaxID=71784 RepID=A0A1Y2AU29_9TREE|nr:hypothetical protein BCR39DRAFT_287210 [Naematelia encephala]